jgi:hypothetical protein
MIVVVPTQPVMSLHTGPAAHGGTPGLAQTAGTRHDLRTDFIGEPGHGVTSTTPAAL